ncbi:MAG: hemerythrin domain-containing protein [Chloroflexi bacterium]|nr:hemerythrin domain-containing protein [Chloroflexota bacterium]
MQATEALMSEHRVIERMLRVIHLAARKLDAGVPVSPDSLRKMVDFIRTFADKCHHAKEEGLLFPAMEQKGIPKDGGPIGVMLLEHDEGRSYVRQMAEAIDRYEQGDRSAAKTIADNARNYAELLEQHIRKEDGILYHMADMALSEEEQQSLLGQFEEAEIKAVGPGQHQYYQKLVEDLEKELG